MRNISQHYREMIISAANFAVQKLNQCLWQLSSGDVRYAISTVNGMVQLTILENNDGNES